MIKKRSYRQEFIKKVKEKFNDLQSGIKDAQGLTGKSCNDKDCKVRHTTGMDKKR